MRIFRRAVAGRGHGFADKEGGAALLSALVVAAVVGFLAVSMMDRGQLAIRRTMNMIENDQAVLVADALEVWAAGVLAVDIGKNHEDSLRDPWAQELVPPFSLTGYKTETRIEDWQGRLNLNNLLAANDELRQFSRSVLRRLLDGLDLDPELAARIVAPEIKANTPDTGASGGGAAFLPGVRPLVSVTQLRLAPGVDADTYDRLRPYVAVLPLPSQLNVNTAPPRLLAALAPELTVAKMRRLRADPDPVFFGKVEDFLARPEVGGAAIPAFFLTVESRFFMVYSTVSVHHRRHVRRTLLQRSAAGCTTIHRSYGF